MRHSNRRFPWWSLCLTAAVLWAVLALSSHGRAPQDGLPFTLLIDGQDARHALGMGMGPLDTGAHLLLAGLAVAAVVAAVVVGLWLLMAVPLALLAGGALLLALLLLGSVGLPLLAVGLVLGLVALPVLLLVGLLRWLLA